jgi:hypothetical protein
MSRYFFHVVDDRTANLVKDSEGVSYPNVGQAKKEAIGLARDIVGHGLHGSTWQVVVTDEDEHKVLTVSLADVRARKMQTWLGLAHRIATYELGFRSHVFTWLLTAAVLAMIIQAAVLTQRDTQRSSSPSFSHAAP